MEVNMIKWILIFCFLLLTPQATAAGDYLLRPGDAISVSVFGVPEQSFTEIIIRPDGKVAMPIVGEISVDGLSPNDFSIELTRRLSKYYVDPNVTVNVLRFSTMRVYVLGEVSKPGRYELDKSRNLLDAIGMAEGWTKEAAKTKVFIIRKDRKGEPIRANLLDLLNKGDLSQNIPLQEGDAIYLSGNNRIDVIRDVVPVIQSIASGIGAAYDLNNFKTRNSQ